MAEDVKVPLDEIPTKRPRLDDVYCTDKDIDIFDTPNNDIDQVSNVKQQQVFMENEKTENVTSPNRDIDSDHTEQKNDKGDKDEETRADLDDSDNISVLSDLSGLSEEAWKSSGGSLMWVQKQMMLGQDPRNILTKIIPQDAVLPDDLDDYTLWKLVINLLSEPPRREKLQHINTLDDVINLMKTCKKVMILTGAGVSVSCGIPDFRSRDGIYARLAVDFPDLPDPQSMFDIRYFKNDPRPFFKFAKEIYPGQFEPSKSHKFIRLFEIHNILLRNYTQNIDTLEQVAGIQNVIQCHGSFAHATCTACKHKVVADEIRKDIFDQVIPLCPKCPKDSEPAVMKPDIVFFGESLPEEFHRQMAEDKEVCDLLIVIGSSLKVRPVALIPNSLPPTVPQILINREPLKHLTFDVELLGDCDTIVGDLCKRLGEGWSNLSNCTPSLEEVTRDKLRTPPLEMEDSDMVSERQASSAGANLSERRENDKISDTKETNQSERTSAEICENESESKLVESCVETSLKHDTEGDVVIPDSNNKASIAFEDELDELEELRAMWQPKRKESLAKRLEDGQYLFLPPNRYVFPGAEVYSDEESEEEHFPHRLQLLSCSSMSTEEEEDEGENDTSSFSTGGAQEPSTSTAQYSEQQEDKVIGSATNNDNITTTFSEQSKSNEYCTDVATAKISNIQVQQELSLSNHDNSDTHKLEEEDKCSKKIL